MPVAGYHEHLKAHARDALRRGGVLLDVRSPDEHRRLRVPGAVLIPTPLPPLDPDAICQLSIALAQATAGVPRSRPLLVYCAKGKRSRLASSILGVYGFEEVIDLGGIEDGPLREFAARPASSVGARRAQHQQLTLPDRLPAEYLAQARDLATNSLAGRAVTARDVTQLENAVPGVSFRMVTGDECWREYFIVNTVRICVDPQGRFQHAQVG